MQKKFVIDSQPRTTKARAEEMAREWTAVEWHAKTSLASAEGTCARWTSHAVPHWKCQTFQCNDCKEYPEEAQEDAAVEDILFHVYKCKVSLRKDGKERRRLELVQKRTTIGEFHRLYNWPTLRRGRYHSTSYILAARCRQERHELTVGSVSSHRDYGERLSVSFNNQIQS
jgi:hypothetical protein